VQAEPTPANEPPLATHPFEVPKVHTPMLQHAPNKHGLVEQVVPRPAKVWFAAPQPAAPVSVHVPVALQHEPK
jgi:hypothetical protein